uniref:Phosphomevalonate kinase n=1 Tax=Lutzomyia longipalpis TaxID=7200 RepID=A0A1B0CME4_LUTLO
MIEWSEKERAKDYGIFCRKAMENVTMPICIVSDIRRKTDLRWFTENYPRRRSERFVSARGWVFQAGVDDAESECDLDDITDWDFVIDNDQEGVPAEELLKPLLDYKISGGEGGGGCHQLITADLLSLCLLLEMVRALNAAAFDEMLLQFTLFRRYCANGHDLFAQLQDIAEEVIFSQMNSHSGANG